METVTYLNFEWDREKAKRNKIKHGISFKAATAVFYLMRKYNTRRITKEILMKEFPERFKQKDVG